MSLFDVDQTTDQQCLACGATKPAGDDKTTGCAYDQNGRELDGSHKRPARCLNTHRPEHAPFPEGY